MLRRYFRTFVRKYNYTYVVQRCSCTVVQLLSYFRTFVRKYFRTKVQRTTTKVRKYESTLKVQLHVQRYTYNKLQLSSKVQIESTVRCTRTQSTFESTEVRKYFRKYFRTFVLSYVLVVRVLYSVHRSLL